MAPHKIVRMGLTRSFQIVQVFADMTVLEAVTAAALVRRPMREAVRKAEEVLERIGLSGIRNESPASLSLQDKKMLEVAKCVATDPELILLDEVMAGLTLAEAEVPLAIIRDLRDSGITFVMVEHVMPIVMKTADRLLVLNFGQKIADAPPSEILSNQAVRDAYFGEEMPHAEVVGLHAGYGPVNVLDDVSIRVDEHAFFGLLGANNAGKSTLINALSGTVAARRGRIVFDGQDITGLGPEKVVDLGIIQVPEGRLVFPQMSVIDNLLLGGFSKRARGQRQRLDEVFDLFPRLAERRSQMAGTLSGGEQQMLAIGRGLAANPRVLMLDEPSLGLSPLFVQNIFKALSDLHKAGLTILVVRQNLNLTHVPPPVAPCWNVAVWWSKGPVTNFATIPTPAGLSGPVTERACHGHVPTIPGPGGC